MAGWSGTRLDQRKATLVFHVCQGRSSRQAAAFIAAMLELILHSQEILRWVTILRGVWHARTEQKSRPMHRKPGKFGLHLYWTPHDEGSLFDNGYLQYCLRVRLFVFPMLWQVRVEACPASTSPTRAVAKSYTCCGDPKPCNFGTLWLELLQRATEYCQRLPDAI